MGKIARWFTETVAHIVALPVSAFAWCCWGSFFIGMLGAGAVVIRMCHVALRPPSAYAQSYTTLQRVLESGLRQRDASPLWSGVRVIRYSLPSNETSATGCFDSLTVSDNVRNLYPSMRDGGFLADQVALFNEVRRRQYESARASVATDADRDVCGSGTLSILVPEQDGHDLTHLTTSLALENLRVRAPTVSSTYEILGQGSDPSFKYALVSHSGAALLGDSGSLAGSPKCQLFPVPSARLTHLQCLEPGGKANEIDFYSQRDRAPSVRRYLPGLAVLANGKLIPKDSVELLEDGALLQVEQRGHADAPTNVLTQLPGAFLGGIRWINGHNRWMASVAGLPPFIADVLQEGALVSDSALSSAGMLTALTVDKGLTIAVNHALNEWSTKNVDRRNLMFADVAVANVERGAILALGESDASAAMRPRAPNGSSWLRQPVVVGSAIKPVLASAILSHWPELGKLEVRQGSQSFVTSLGNVSFADAPFDTGCEKDLNSWIGLRSFITCSSNLYAASLVGLGMANRDRKSPVDGGNARDMKGERMGTLRIGDRTANFELHFDSSLVHGNDFNRSGLAAGLNDLFDLPTRQAYANAADDSRPWEGFAAENGRVLPRPSSVARIESSRLDLMESNADKTPVRVLVTYSIGEAENRISLFRLMEAYLRIITARNVTVSMVPFPSTASLLHPPKNGLDKFEWYSQLMLGMTGVFTDPRGTAYETVEPVVSSLAKGRFYLVGKTGSVGDGAGRSGVYARTLVVALVPTATPPGSSANCGLIAVVYFRFRTHTEPAHLEFAAQSLLPLLAQNWDRLSGCSK